MRLSKLLFRPLQFRDIPGCSKYPHHFPSLVLIDSCIVQYVCHFARDMANSKRIILNKPFREHLLVSLSGFFRFDEIAREIASYKLFTRNPGHEFSCVINVGYLSFGADSDEGVKACFDKTPRIQQSSTQLLYSTFALS